MCPPPHHLGEFTTYVLQYRYEGDFLDPNGGQTRGAVLSFMEEYLIQKKLWISFCKIAFLEPGHTAFEDIRWFSFVHGHETLRSFPLP